MIWTSNYSKSFGDPRAVAISRGVPKGFRGAQELMLAPTWALMRIEDEELFRGRYRAEVLSRLNAKEVAARLEGKVLLCYEGEGKFCHRHIVAEWLRREAGVEVEEIAEKKSAPKGCEQLALF